jgi:hypothetical protein
MTWKKKSGPKPGSMGGRYQYILGPEYRWGSWAAPKDRDGKIDLNRARIGDDLRDFVNDRLFSYLQAFKDKASGPNTLEYKIGEIFGEIKNRIQRGYNLREIIDQIDELHFRSQAEKHELSYLYEAKIRNMGGASGHQRVTKEFPIAFPSLNEQQRIVGVLDKAFEGIAAAKANAEKNLQNSRALFESHLYSVFSQRSSGWVETTIDKISTNLDSKRVPITKNVRSSGKYPYYGASVRAGYD